MVLVIVGVFKFYNSMALDLAIVSLKYRSMYLTYKYSYWDDDN